MVLKNGTVLTADFTFMQTDITIEDGNIVSVGFTESPGVELDGAYIVPGLVDIHTHGCIGYDHLDGVPEGTVAMRRYLAERGTTSILATLMTQDAEKICKAAENVAMCAACEEGAHLRGIYMEGPFFSDRYKGAQHPDYLCDPNLELLAELQKRSENRVKIVSIAPERDGAIAFIRGAGDARVFIGHTDSDYETAKAAIEAGACGLTHTYNGMRGLHHRSPNALGAALEADTVYCECICDGYHIHPTMIRLLYRMVGRERFVMISDSLMSAGLPDGEYISGGQQVFVRNGEARLENGTIAGSSSYLLQEVRNLVEWGIMSLEDAVYAASAVPAKAANLYDRVGSIAPGKAADLLVLNPDLSLRQVILGAD